MASAKPGKPVRGSETGRPIMAALDLLGRRWSMRIIWELRGEPLTFRALQEKCTQISPSVLNTRIQELREAELIAPDAYALTPLGQELLQAMGPLVEWSERWAAELE